MGFNLPDKLIGKSISLVQGLLHCTVSHLQLPQVKVDLFEFAVVRLLAPRSTAMRVLICILTIAVTFAVEIFARATLTPGKVVVLP